MSRNLVAPFKITFPLSKTMMHLTLSTLRKTPLDLSSLNALGCYAILEILTIYPKFPYAIMLEILKYLMSRLGLESIFCRSLTSFLEII
jgi:hypothetical protein